MGSEEMQLWVKSSAPGKVPPRSMREDPWRGRKDLFPHRQWKPSNTVRRTTARGGFGNNGEKLKETGLAHR